MSQSTDFNEYRSRMNQRLLASDDKIIKRIFSIDTLAFQDGALDQRTKELLGLTASMVLRCDDCVRYHLEKCHEIGFNSQEIYEAFGIANLIGGTIVIPHTRRAAEYWDELTSGSNYE